MGDVISTKGIATRSGSVKRIPGILPTIMAEPAGELIEDFERYRNYLRVLAEIQTSQNLKNRLDLSGVVQQTMLDAYLAIQRGTPVDGAKPLPWLRHLLANNLTDEIRRQQAGKRAVQREVSLEAQLERSSIQMEAILAADQSTPAERLLREEKMLQLTAALAGLPEAQRQAIILQHWHGYSVQQIAETLGRTQMAVAGLLKRGLIQLRTQCELIRD